MKNHRARKNIVAGLVLLASSVGWGSLLQAAEYWVQVPTTTFPLANSSSYLVPTDVVTFKDHIYLAVVSMVDPPESQIWRTSNGLDWQMVEDLGSDPRFFYGFFASSDTIYAQMALFSGTTEIIRSQDGANWDVVANDAPTPYSGLFIFNDYLYGSNNFSIGRSDGLGPSLQWTPVLPISGPVNFLLVIGNELLDWTGTSPINITTDGLQWTSSTVIIPPEINLNIFGFGSPFATASGRLYAVSGTTLISTADPRQGWATEFPITQQDATSAPTSGLLVDLFGSPHFVPPSGRALVRVSQGSWEPAVADLPNCAGQGRLTAATSGNIAYIYCCSGLYQVARGLHHVSAYSGTYPTGMAQNQTNALVLAGSLHINMGDTLTALTVTNAGTAEAGRDITRLRLFRQSPGVINNASLVDLEPQADQKTWSTPASFSASFQDGDVLYVAADIAPYPQDQATCRFSAQSWRWTNHSSSSSLSILAAPQAQTISATIGNPALAKIDGVLVAPQPAADSVHFFYSLDETSDVTVKIFDRTGSLVSEIQDSGKSAALRSETVWNAAAMASGVYWATIQFQGASGGKREFKTKLAIKK